jgi:TetR/AcrR family transcriptional repressor of nem operon
MEMAKAKGEHASKTRLLDAALQVIRTKGYAATTVDDVCAAAGLTKGSFFHHFAGKEELALAAAAHFAATANAAFAAAPYRTLPDARERLFGYVDFRTALLQRSLPEFTCLLGTMVQETYATHPALRAACETHISAHADRVARDVAEARARCAPDAPWSAESLAFFTQAVLQGAFILAKAKGGPAVAADCLQHLRRYLEFLFPDPEQPTEPADARHGYREGNQGVRGRRQAERAALARDGKVQSGAD